MYVVVFGSEATWWHSKRTLLGVLFNITFGTIIATPRLPRKIYETSTGRGPLLLVEF